MTEFWIGTIEQGLIFGIMVLGVYITYKILDFPDLTVDGSFPLGASVAAYFMLKGTNPLVACVLAFICGMLSGAITGFLHVKLKITNLLSGILVMIGLYSINLRIMGKANVPLFNGKSIFMNGMPSILIIGLFAVSLKILLDLFLNTKFGFVLKATGDNEQMVKSLGINTGMVKILGLMISNGLVALSGAIMAQYQQFADVGMGSGVVVMGLASIIFGESLLKKIPIVLPTTVALVGSILYKCTISAALKLGLPPTDLKFVTSLIVVIALAINSGAIKFKERQIFSVRRDHIATSEKSM